MTQAARLIQLAPWLMLATSAPDGSPHASYVPFGLVEGGLGIVISRLAAHTANLQREQRACALVVDARNVTESDGTYAQARISVDVRAIFLAPESLQAVALWSTLEKRHGAIVRTLRDLPDFVPVVLEPTHARFIEGFASASDLDAAQMQAVLRTVH